MPGSKLLYGQRLSLTPYGLGQLSYGLHFLFRVDRAESYEQRLQLLKSKGLSSTSHFLAAYLPNATPQDICRCCPPGNSPLADGLVWTREEVETNLSAKDTDGPDDLNSGPFDIWWYVNKRSSVHDTVFQGHNTILRRYGYVMCDVLEFFDKEEVRSRVRAARRQNVADRDEVNQVRSQMERSWQERAAIYEDGGRGYWSAADVSHITWERAKQDAC